MQPDPEMSFAAAVSWRRSVRRFLPDPVPDEDVRRMVALAGRAASAGNAQMWRFVAVRDRELLAAMKRAVDERFDELTAHPDLSSRRRDIKAARTYSTFFADAPLCVAVLCLPYRSRIDDLIELAGYDREQRQRLRQRPDIQSVGAATQLLITAAFTLGYGSCWMSAPVLAADDLERLVGAEPGARLCALVPIGRPAGSRRRSPRAPVDAILSFR